MQSSVVYENGTLMIRLSGELDHCEAASAMSAITSAVEEYLPRQCVLDFTDLSFMDSSGIAVLVKAERLLRRFGGGVSVQNANAQVGRVLELADLSGMIKDQKKECELI